MWELHGLIRFLGFSPFLPPYAGTLADKISAMTLLSKATPTHSFPYIDSLLAMARKRGGGRQTTLALDALKDLFISDLLPPDRKLLTFARHLEVYQEQQRQQQQQQGSGGKKKSKKQDKQQQKHNNWRGEEDGSSSSFSFPPPSRDQLLLWFLEDGFKKRFAQVVALLEEGTHDAMEYVKRGRLVALAELLGARPENEGTLLAIIVNKLGDADRKIASKAQFLLARLIDANPGMKLPVVKEVERVLFRPNISERAQYYAVTFLNQVRRACACMRMQMWVCGGCSGGCKLHLIIISTSQLPCPCLPASVCALMC